MDLYFAGGEISGHRKMLAQAGVNEIAVSYMGLRRRSKFHKPYYIQRTFPGTEKVFLDSGAYTINRAVGNMPYTDDELKTIAAHYMHFVKENVEWLTMVSELDILPLGLKWVEGQRRDFWNDIPPEKFLPIWHIEYGIENLYSLAQKYQRVGVPQTVLGDRSLVPVLNSLVSDYGTKLHGVAMTKPSEMSAIRWDSVASTSWLSPAQYGDTIVWTGKELKRYPRHYKEQARKQHRTLFESAGFDAEKIRNDDTKEVLRFTIWSWQQLVRHLERHRIINAGPESNGVVATPGSEAHVVNAESEGGEVDTPTPEKRNSIATRVRGDDERTSLPVLSTAMQKSTDGEGGEVGVVRVRGQSMRVCDTCFLKSKCPAFDEQATCAYDIPVEIRTRDQVRAMTESLIEWQFQRVAFMKMAEDLEGGYADPNLSQEIDRAMKLVAKKAELEQEGFSLKIEAQSRGQAGTISRLFGKESGEQLRQLEAPIQVPDAMAQLGIVDADVVDL